MMRDRHGNLIPEIAPILAGDREADRLGLELDANQRYELGRSLLEHADPTDPAELAELLAQLQNRNRALRRVLERRPSVTGNRYAQDPELPVDRGLDLEHPSSAQREQDKKPRWNRVEDFLAEARDDDHDWS